MSRCELNRAHRE